MFIAHLFISQKALARKKALKNSTSLSAEIKTKLEPLLRANYMSSDESILDSNDEFSDNAAENAPCPVPTRRNKLLKKRATWRSEEFQVYMHSLDRKIERRRTEQGRVMVLDCEYGDDSTRSAPADCPEWARTIFD